MPTETDVIQYNRCLAFTFQI